jgi:hypothetical protein
MMAKLNLMRELAINAIKAYYNKQPVQMYSEIESISKYYKCHTRLLVKLYQKVHRMEMNNIIVRSVLFRQPEIRKKLIIGKYKDNKEWVSLSISLYTSVAQLNNWHNEFIEDVETTMFYRIKENEIFSQRKILNIINVITQQIDFLEGVDENGQIYLDKNLLYFLKMRKSKFEALYADLHLIVDQMRNDNKKRILIERLQNESIKISGIAREYNISQPTMSQFFSQIKDELLSSKKGYMSLLDH